VTGTVDGCGGLDSKLVAVTVIGMPRCEGLPYGPCPDRRCDETVRLGEGELMLCHSCDFTRHQAWLESVGRTATAAPVTKVRTGNRRAPPPAPAPKPNPATGDAPAPAPAQQQKCTPVNPAGGSEDVAHESHVQSVLLSAHTSVHMPSRILLNELLSYVCCYRNKSSVDCIRRVVLQFYLPEEIAVAKKLLVREFGARIKNSSLITERRSSTARPAHDAEVNDIISILDELDVQQALDIYMFVCSDITRIPKYGPEELNIGAVVERQVRIETVVDSLAATVGELNSRDSLQSKTVSSEAMDKIAGLLDSKISSLSARLEAQTKEMKKTCTEALATSTTSAQQQTVIDRSCNIVLFGIEECNDSAVWCNKVDEVLSCVNGQSVNVRDMFRLGRFHTGKNRPILVKLHSAWDRRILLSRRGNLRNSAFNRVFIAPDEPVEVRRKKVLERMKKRAENEGSHVSVVDNVLIIDGVRVYSVAEGPVGRNNPNTSNNG